jgi:hypothetical protein
MNEPFSPQQSLQLIKTMIDKTRRDYSDGSRYFLLWGWTTMLALIAQFILKSVLNYSRHYHVWWVTIVATIITIVFVVKERKHQRARTYIGESMAHLWTGMGISFFIISMIFFRIGWSYSYPFFITLYGLGTFISGRMLQFSPFVIGGITCWIIAVAAAWFNMEYQMLFAAAALLVSYIIPGHMLHSIYRNQRQQYAAGE